MRVRQIAVWALVASFGLVMMLAASGSSALAQVIDPQLFVQQSTTSTNAAGGDPNIISNTGAFGVGVAGSHTMNNPLLIVVGVYDGMGTPTVSYSGCSTPSDCPAAAMGTYGLTGVSNVSFTSGDAFGTLGLSSGGSESFTNWSGADTADHFAAPTSFSLYAFSIPVSLDPADSPISVDESGAANGSFILAYGCEGTSGTSACSGGNIGQTVFTNTGLVDAPPAASEPESAALLGIVLLGLGAGAVLRRRKSLA